MMDTGSWALLFAEARKIDPAKYLSFDRFVQAMENARDEETARSVSEFVKRPRVRLRYHETHCIDGDVMKCRSCGLSLVDIHADRVRCTGSREPITDRTDPTA